MNVLKNLALTDNPNDAENLPLEAPLILKVALAVPLQRLFDYLPPEGVPARGLEPGVRVEVPFGRQVKVGLILEVSLHSIIQQHRLKRVIRILDPAPLLGARDIQLLNFAARYYHHAIGEVASAGLTTLLRTGRDHLLKATKSLELIEKPEVEIDVRRAPRQAALLERLRSSMHGRIDQDLLAQDGFVTTARTLVERGWAKWVESMPLDPEVSTVKTQKLNLSEIQTLAVAQLEKGLHQFQVSLLFGVTGSGKTEVYLEIAEQVIDRGLQVLILVPEINLTPQLESRIRMRLASSVRILHSGLRDRERMTAWKDFQNGKVDVLLGTRSAVFVPAKNLGLIILDEEHDASFKQQDGFHFSARDIAIVRGSLNKIPVILGSATPSLETYHNAAMGRYQRIDLPIRAGGALAPRIEIIDIRSLWLSEGLSPILLNGIRDTLEKKQQTLLFVNRRGYAPILSCHSCGWLAECRYCDTRMVSHRTDQNLKCHHCGHERPHPKACPECGSEELMLLGLGTERVEEALRKHFPEARVSRIDRDSTRAKGHLEQSLREAREGTIDILIGTQMLAKGHDFPNVTLAGILDVDGGLFSTDFRSWERLAQLIIQVAGRSGRSQRAGRVLLQTRHPEHPMIREIVRADYEAIARACLCERETLSLPPFTHQALIRCDSRKTEEAKGFLEDLCGILREQNPSETQILGPVEAPLLRRGNRYRWQLLLQSEQREPLHRALGILDAAIASRPPRASIRWSIDVDPIDPY